MNEEQNKQRRSLVSYLIIFFIGCLAMYAVVYFFPTTITESVTKLEKDVTVTDTGIADAPEGSVVCEVCTDNAQAGAEAATHMYDAIKDGFCL